MNFYEGTLASILGPYFLSESGISFLDSLWLISIKDQCFVQLLSLDNQTDSKDLIVKFIQRFVKPLLHFGVQVFLITPK